MHCSENLPGGATRFSTGNGEQLRSSQAQPASQAAWLLLSFSPFPALNRAAPPCKSFADRLSPHCKAHPGGTKCYIDSYPANVNLKEARKTCARIGAKLPTILDYRDVDYLKDIFADKSGEMMVNYT